MRHGPVLYCASLADLPETRPPGDLAAVGSPLGLWAYDVGGWQLVAAPSGEPIVPPPASEDALGTVELATQAEIEAGTAGAYVATASRLKAELDRRAVHEAWITPTLLNAWVNFGAPFEAAGYRKTPWGEVQLRGTIKNGAIADGTILFSLPAGYRPSATRGPFITGTGASGSGRLFVDSAGQLTVAALSGNNQLSLESVRFDV